MADKLLGRDHFIASMGIASLAYPDLITNEPAALMFIGAVGLSSLVPDLDSDNSIISKHLGTWIAKHVAHRGFLHSIFGWALWSILLTICLYWTNSWLITGLIIGYLLHIVEDSFSVSGIRWFAPFSSYDEYVFNKYGTYFRPVHHWKELSDGEKEPCRHFWGRGYRVGGKGELIVTGILGIVAIWKLISMLS